MDLEEGPESHDDVHQGHRATPWTGLLDQSSGSLCPRPSLFWAERSWTK